MPTGFPSLTTAAVNVERARRALLDAAAVPPDILNRALAVAREGLEAKETKFFSYKGQVVETREVVNWEARQRASDQIFSVTGAYVRKEDAPKAQPTFGVEVDIKTGIVRLVMRSESEPAPTSTLDVTPGRNGDAASVGAGTQLVPQPSHATPVAAQAELAALAHQEEERSESATITPSDSAASFDEESEIRRIRVARGRVSRELRDLLLDRNIGAESTAMGKPTP